ncbi:MAG: hypothetical protein GWP67_01065 [Gammaproteobacteria bacterium]|jgi:hypothetical protein|nr:hypothetical protein [Gammaproteobacteria bacterium]
MLRIFLVVICSFQLISCGEKDTYDPAADLSDKKLAALDAGLGLSTTRNAEIANSMFQKARSAYHPLTIGYIERALKRVAQAQ